MSSTTTTITFAPAEAVREEKRHLSARSGLSALWWAMRRGVLAARESRNELPWLAPEKARELFDRWLRGEWAQPQWAWELMEKYDETLFAVKRARLAALNEMPWQVVVDADAVGEDAARQALAEAQRQKLVELLGNVENLRAALTYLGMADFRGIAALELTGNEERMRWEVIEPWLLCRPNLAGPIMYNERAEDTPAHPELLERERVILRTAEPIDLPAMFLLTAKHHGTQAWDAFLDTFGIPSIFLETPPNTTEEQAQEYQQKVEEIVGEGRGTIPSGAKFHTVETGQKETKSFQERADWCKNALLILATGGLLTITAQSGSGTLAGNAHADSFERLCAATAQDISTVVDFQFCRPALQSIFPGQPILAHFELAPEKEEDLAAQAQIIATLAGAGFKPSAEVVSEMMGFEVAAVEQQADFGSRILDVGFNSSAAAPQVMNRKAETPAPQAPNLQIQNQTSKIQNTPESSPLSEAELAAFASLATPNPDRMAQRQREVEAALRAAADLPAADAPQAPSFQIQNPTSNIQNSEDECRAADPEHCRVHGEAEDDDREPWEKRQEERERLEALRDELDRQEEAARDAEASGDPSHYNEQASRDRWSALSREGDPQTREDIEKRLGELDAADAKEDNLRAAGYDEETIKRVTGERKSLSPEEYEQINRFIDDRPKIKQEILSKIPDGGLKIDLSKQGLSETIYTKKAVREMLSDKAIDASVRNGCPVSAHVEAVRRTPELVTQSELKGNTAPTKKKNKIDKISHLEAPFQADDKKNYIAHYTVHHPKPNPQQPNKPAGSPRLYFLFIRKGKPE